MDHIQSQVSTSHQTFFKLKFPKQLKSYRNESLLAIALILSSLILDSPNTSKLIQVGEATGELVVDISAYSVKTVISYFGYQQIELASQP
ncbi:MAG: hypothetical protein OQK12_17725 [Motiliproteus sp.]|nr:hypothetical protein [Motiliproteus sp.]MCW9053656.1 hypothetical protein [Motiliproteus sp.]